MEQTDLLVHAQEPSRFWEMQHGSTVIQPVDSKYVRDRESPRGRAFMPTGPGQRSNSAPTSDAISKWASKPLADFVNCNSSALTAMIATEKSNTSRRPANSTFDRLNMTSLHTTDPLQTAPVQRTNLRKRAPSSQPSSPHHFVTISGGGIASSGQHARASPAPYATD